MGKTVNFANSGSETFNMEDPAKETQKTQEDQNKDQKGSIVLNIEDEGSEEGVILDSQVKHKTVFKPTGNVIVDFFNRINFYLITHTRIKTMMMVDFYHLLSVMINSGIPTVQALRALIKQLSKSQRMQLIIEEMIEDIESGSSFSGAMINYPDVFSEKDVGMVQSGEAVGQLAKVLDNLATDTQKAYEIKAKVKSAMTYPTVVFLLLIAVIVGMMIFVVPKLSDLFASVGENLPLITRIVIGMSDFMVNYNLLFLGIVGALFLGIMAFKRTEYGKFHLDNFKIKVPILGRLFKLAYLARFSRALSSLLDSKLSIVNSIEITANSIGNEPYRRRLMMAREDIKQGIPLNEAMTESYLFPAMLISMIEVGEKTAALDEMMLKVARFYEQELDTAVEGLSKIIEPIILIVIGATVGGVVSAIMLPIMSLSNLADKM
jgi:type IV pilus assembly protein PilC